LNRFDFFATIERYHTFQNPTSEEKLDLAMSYCAIRDGMRILDVGCGKAWLLRRLAKRFDIRATGLEINRKFAAQARSFADADGVAERIEIVQGPALDFHAEPASFDVVMCIGASFALDGFENAIEWMKRYAKRGGIVAIGEVFAKRLPFPADIPAAGRGCDERTLWMTVETMRSHGLPLRGLVESSVDDWNRYHSLHWQAGLDWSLENPGHDDIKMLTDPAGQRMDLEFDGRYIGWAIFVARNGLD
jgi:cyclopropane fatty-acyl-phospholipid synthase-like methyltransferase